PDRTKPDRIPAASAFTPGGAALTGPTKHYFTFIVTPLPNLLRSTGSLFCNRLLFCLNYFVIDYF
ncbi:hypothetical protein ACWWJS_22180, partial [Enterobacter cloacae]